MRASKQARPNRILSRAPDFLKIQQPSSKSDFAWRSEACALAPSGRMYIRSSGVEHQGGLDPFRHAEQAQIFAVGPDDLDAERQAVSAEAYGQRQRGHAEQGPRRAILGVAGVVEACRRFAKCRQGKDSGKTGKIIGEPRPQTS